MKASYDANGNETMTTLVASMTYDANHNAVAAGSTGLTYDAFGRLVEFGGKAVVYGPSGEKLGVFNGTTNTMAFLLPGGSEALYTTGALTSLRRKDWLGSSRVSTSWTHAVVSKAAYAPFGESYATSGTGDLDFTGQTQDSVSTLYDFPARKYDYVSGRWTSPDPGAWSVVDPTNPQSFNRYAYVMNMPLRLIDPDGLDGVNPCASEDGEMDPPVCDPPTSTDATQSAPPAASDTTYVLFVNVYLNPDLLDNLLQQAIGSFYNRPQQGSFLGGPNISSFQTSGPMAAANVPAPSNGCMVVSGKTVCPSRLDNKYSLDNAGQRDYREDKPGCNLHVGVNKQTGQINNAHMDEYNPNYQLFNHLVLDWLPDKIYDLTGYYPIPAGRTFCQ